MKPVELAERGLVPDSIIRAGIRQRLADGIKKEREIIGADPYRFVAELKESPVALATDKANEQHYELPTTYFEAVLGPRLKYSCCFWPEGVEAISDAETQSLDLVASRADIKNGMSILDMGCGWGSFSLYAAERFPESTITAVSNSNGQREFIKARAAERSLENLTVLTADMNDFQAPGQYDRVVSIEMFEHMRNYQTLMGRIANWLNESGKLFVHIFTHRQFAYPYRSDDPDDWMAEHFFTGGIMPSTDLLLHFQDDLALEHRWWMNGQHYSHTLEAWLDRHDDKKAELLPTFGEVYGEPMADRWFNRWRMFYLACSELFAYNQGNEWFVSHYLFAKR